MPYIDEERREEVDWMIANAVGHADAMSEGDLNYAITRIVYAWFRSRGRSYATALAAWGTFGMAAAEFYRRVVVPHEDDKRRDNGDVYDEGR